jgi:hypothetical protein
MLVPLVERTSGLSVVTRLGYSDFADLGKEIMLPSAKMSTAIVIEIASSFAMPREI